MAAMGYMTEAYIIMDYMNKWLPFKHRATTSDAFGQAGESVHGATIYVRVLPEQATEVISNEAARLRFDNAACYHGTLYWLLVSIMENVTGIKTTGVGMNESGEGKDESDSSFNTVKAYVRRLVHLGSLDAKTTADFVGALNSGEGMVGMIARVVEILRPTVSVDDTLDQITRFSHFRHEGTWLRCWEQYDIGPGRLFSREELQKLLKEALPETTGVQRFVSSSAPKPEAKVKGGTLTMDVARAKREEASQKREARAAAIESSVIARRDVVQANRTTSSCPKPGCKHPPFLRIERMQQHTQKCNPPPPPPDYSLNAPRPALRSYQPHTVTETEVPARPVASLRFESKDPSHTGEEYDPYSCDAYGLDMPLLLADIEVGDGVCGGKWTLILSRPECDVLPMGYAVKSRVTPQQKTEVQVAMLEEAFQKGLARGTGRSSRESDTDILIIHAVSAPQNGSDYQLVFS
ncbi:hypothetical protein CYMTET_33837 [Cymbomonas tetramitiformis]|uniref:Uncharacterized protein n=1 Tax=Cymbomonas tetramitiformis TaxID=36881 RepID=A0AAE0FCF5_9CHLO|nr:hypothetical protein CYMTET_33837 [Cymbomonas tetramitiformis]